MSEAKEIRKQSAQYDLFHRLHSIAADERFVKTVARESYQGRFEVVANQRCGTWYCDPSTSSSTYAYFKSTDGHTNNWNFNLRRSNVPFASHAERQGGLILVDSTRRGKRMPDALSKTVPIWCAVINLAIQVRRGKLASQNDEESQWDISLYLPPRIVSSSEKAQIESRLLGWADALENSSLPLPDLAKPLRPFFIHPSTSFPPRIPTSPPYTPIICLSASRWVNGEEGEEIPSVTRSRDGETVGFECVPGAGDDDELWGRGLSPAVFHANKSLLLATTREQLADVVDHLVQDAKVSGPRDALAEFREREDEAPMSIGVPLSGSRLGLDVGAPVTPPASVPCSSRHTPTLAIRVVVLEKVKRDVPYILQTQQSIPAEAVLALPNPKTDPKPYAFALGALVAFVRKHIAGEDAGSIVLRPADRADLDTALRIQADPTDANGKYDDRAEIQLSPAELVDARKAIIPLALVLLCALPELASANSTSSADIPGPMTKAEIADELHKLVALWPDGNPPRAALRRVNEYLMSEGRRGGG